MREKLDDLSGAGKNAVLSVYFEGTAFRIDALDEDQVAQFYQETDAHDITGEDAKIEDVGANNQFKMGFSGTRVEYGMRGLLFAHGLEEQCRKVSKRIHELLNTHKKITLNVLGLSRGGIGAIFLAKKISKIPADRLQVNLMLFDPVPGNLISVRKLFDIPRQTTASKSLSLKECNNLHSVLALYPYEPLSDVLFHAPVVPEYPDHAIVHEEIILGCHAGAADAIDNYRHHTPSLLSFHLIKNFLLKSKTILSKKINKLGLNPEFLVWGLDAAKVLNTRRFTHNHRGLMGGVIKANNNGAYLNTWHYQEKLRLNPGGVIERPTFKLNLSHHGVPRPDNIGNYKDLLVKFIDFLIENSSKKSVEKQDLLWEIQSQVIKSGEITKEMAVYVLRDTLAISLQRQRFQYSPITQSRSGNNAMDLLNHRYYKKLKSIVSEIPGKLNYDNLTRFVTFGKNEKKFFKSENKKQMYCFFSEKNTNLQGDDDRNQFNYTYEIKDHAKEIQERLDEHRQRRCRAI